MRDDEKSQSTEIFDRRLLRRRRDRVARKFVEHAFLFDEVAARLADRLQDVARCFPMALELGSRTGLLAAHLPKKAGIQSLVRCERSLAMTRLGVREGCLDVVAEGEALPFAEQRFDLVLSLLELHWINDLPGLLLQINRCLKPDGLFLAAFFGGATLHELGDSLMRAEVSCRGGVHPRVSPFVDLRDAGALLQRAGFALPVADLDSITVEFSSPLALMKDLQGMGESYAGQARAQSFTGRQTLLEAARLYQENQGLASGRIPATFEIIYLTAWAPSGDQPKPLRPGSAKGRLADALGTFEKPLPDKAGKSE